MLELKRILEAAEALNKSKLAKIKVDLKEKDRAKLVENFLDATGTVSEEDAAKKLPDWVTEVNNALIDEEEGNVQPSAEKVPEPEKPVEEVAKKEEKKPAGKKEKTKPEKTVAKKEEKKPAKEVAKKEEKKIAVTTRVMMLVVDDPSITNDSIKTMLQKEGYSVSVNTIAMQKNDTLKVLSYLKSKK